MDHLVMESESELESGSRRPERSKGHKWKRKGLLSDMWQIRSSSSSMLVEESAARISDSAVISELKQVYNISLRINQFRLYSQINSEVFKTYDLQLNNFNSKVRVKHCTHYGSVSCVLSHSGQVGGLSGHRLNINHFTQTASSESGVKEIYASLPYPTGPSLPNHLQEPWAALIDTGAVTSIAPSSFAPHVPVTPHAGHLVYVNGGETKIKGQKTIAYNITHRIVMNITFLIVDDVMNTIVGLDALHQSEVRFHLFQSGKSVSSTKRS